MEISYDKDADALYIEFQKGKFAKNKKLDAFTILDLDKNDHILGLELLNVAKRLPKKALAEVHLKNLLPVMT